MSELNPTVWADGYGKWHASVPISTRPEQARVAHRAIMAEILERSPRGTTARDIRLRVALERVTNHGTVIYGEVWS